MAVFDATVGVEVFISTHSVYHVHMVVIASQLF